MKKRSKTLLILVIVISILTLSIVVFLLPKTSFSLKIDSDDEICRITYDRKTFIHRNNHIDNCWDSIYSYEINHNLDCPLRKIGWYHNVYFTEFYMQENQMDVIYGTGIQGKVFFSEEFDPYEKILTIENKKTNKVFEASIKSILGEKTDLIHGNLINNYEDFFELNGILQEHGILARIMVFKVDGNFYVTFPDGLAPVYFINEEFIETL